MRAPELALAKQLGTGRGYYLQKHHEGGCAARGPLLTARFRCPKQNHPFLPVASLTLVSRHQASWLANAYCIFTIEGVDVWVEQPEADALRQLQSALVFV